MKYLSDRTGPRAFPRAQADGAAGQKPNRPRRVRVRFARRLAALLVLGAPAAALGQQDSVVEARPLVERALTPADESGGDGLDDPSPTQ